MEVRLTCGECKIEKSGSTTDVVADFVRPDDLVIDNVSYEDLKYGYDQWLIAEECS